MTTKKKALMMFQTATSRYYLCACVVEQILLHTVPSPSWNAIKTEIYSKQILSSVVTATSNGG